MKISKPVTIIIVQLFIFLYVLSLEKEKCICSESWKRNFIKVFSYILLVINSIIIILIVNPPNLSIITKIPYSLLIAIFVLYVGASIFYSVICIMYFIKLHSKKNCECSEDWKKYLLLLPLISLTLALIGVIVFLVVFLIMMRK